MKSLHLIIIVTSLVSHSSATNAKRFTVVSSSRSVAQLYSEIRTTTPSSSSLQQPIEVDGPSRALICRDILSSRYFAQNNQYPAREKCFWCFSSGTTSECPTTEIDVSLPSERTVRENVFTCPAREDKKYYVSREYNLEPESNDEDSSPVVGRFVFHVQEKAFKLYALAEKPAKVFTSLDYGVERIYLRRKRVYNIADRRRRDPLCRLEEAEKARLCSAVFNASYFKRKFKFSSSTIVGGVRGSCDSKPITVSFQTADADAQADGGRFDEWMMRCDPATNRSVRFLVSQAYEPNQIFVYVRHEGTGNVYLESLGTNVRLNVSYPFRKIQS